jgi:hypothetical protein
LCALHANLKSRLVYIFACFWPVSSCKFARGWHLGQNFALGIVKKQAIFAAFSAAHYFHSAIFERIGGNFE